MIKQTSTQIDSFWERLIFKLKYIPVVQQLNTSDQKYTFQFLFQNSHYLLK